MYVYIDVNAFGYVAESGPIMWLSAPYFDGNVYYNNIHAAGRATNQRKDVLGNKVHPAGHINIVNDHGRSAYHFHHGVRIMSDGHVNKDYTFMVIFRRIAPKDHRGRFFTGTRDNNLFASWNRYYKCWHVNHWVSSTVPFKQADDKMQFYVGTNNDGMKNMWDVRSGEHFIKNYVNVQGVGNTWGQTAVGHPTRYGGEVANVYIYEALVFDRSLHPQIRQDIISIFKGKYGF